MKAADKEKLNLIKKAESILKRNKELGAEEKMKIQSFLLVEYKKRTKE